MRVTLLSIKCEASKKSTYWLHCHTSSCEVTTTLLQRSVKMGKAFKLYSKIFWERGGRGFTYITFITVFCYDSEKSMAPHASTLAWKIPWTEGLVGCSPQGR